MLAELIGDRGLASTVLEQISDCVIVTDTDWAGDDGPTILFANGALCELTGYERAEIVGMRTRMFHATDTDEEAIARMREALSAGEKTREDLLHRKKDGTPYWIEVEASPLRNEAGETVAYTWIQRIITDRKQAEIERDATDRWASAGERIANLGTWGYDLAERRTYWSNGLYKIFERDRMLGPPPNDYVLPFVVEEHRSILSEAMLRAVRDGRSFEIEIRTMTEKGNMKWLRMRGEALLRKDGRTRAVVGATRDVTREREVRRRLSHAISINETLERNFNAARAVAKIGVFDYSVTDDLQFWSDELFEMTGLAKESFPAAVEEFASRIDPQDRPKFDRLFTAAIEQGKGYETVVLFHRPDGKRMHMQIVADIEDGEDGRRIVGIARDVTDEVEASDLLRMQEERFRMIADAVSDVLWDYDLVGGTMWATPSWPNKLGISLDAEGLSPAQWTRFVSEGDRERYMQSLVNTLRSGANMWREETTVTDKHGVTINVQINAMFLRGEDGRVYRALGNVRNIDSEKYLNELLARARGLESLSQMTGGIAHDFNNLLMIILGNTEILEMAGLGDDEREAIELIGRAATSAARLTQRLLEFSGRTRLKASIVIMPDFLAGLIPLVQSALTNRIEVQLELGEELWPTQADPTALEQSLLNLALNARDAIDGGGRLTIACHNQIVTEEMAGSRPDLAPGPYLRVTVSDDGKGMDEQVLARALEPYFTTKDVGKGTGLGLSSAYGFARQTGGTLEIFSEAGRGTTINLYLPAVIEVPEEEPVADPQRGERVGKGRRILLVEDQPDIRKHLERMLARLDYSVTSVDNAASALERLRGPERFDLLFTDIVMPGGMNGVELAQKAGEIAPGMKVLFTSGFAGTAFDGADLDDRNTIRILNKPYRSDELTSALEDAFAEN
jgi:PAS domain S-box-containing protein